MMSSDEFAKFYVSYVNHIKDEKINLELTYICPLQCPFCDRQRGDPRIDAKIKESSHMTIEDYRKVLSFGNSIEFCGQISDPIYNVDFLYFLHEFKKHENKKLIISTTATRKKLDWWKEAFSLSGENVKWLIGLDGTDQETANIYRVNTRFDEVMDVMQLGSSMGVNIEWQFIVFRHNEHQIDRAKELAKQLGVTLKICKSNRWSNSLTDKYKIYPPSKEWTSDAKFNNSFIVIHPE